RAPPFDGQAFHMNLCACVFALQRVGQSPVGHSCAVFTDNGGPIARPVAPHSAGARIPAFRAPPRPGIPRTPGETLPADARGTEPPVAHRESAPATATSCR